MRKRRVYAVVIGVSVLVGLFVCTSSRQREPKYGGKRLSEWVKQLGSNVVYNGDAQAAAEYAIRTIGTNAVPHLLVWIQYEPPVWRQKLYRTGWLRKIGISMRPRDNQAFLQIGAAKAFRALGSEAKGAISELSRWMNDPKRDLSLSYVPLALASLGPDAIPVLVRGLTNQQPWVRWLFSNRLQELGTNAQTAVPALVELLNDPHPNVRDAATNALREIDPAALVKSGKNGE